MTKSRSNAAKFSADHQDAETSFDLEQFNLTPSKQTDMDWLSKQTSTVAAAPKGGKARRAAYGRSQSARTVSLKTKNMNIAHHQLDQNQQQHKENSHINLDSSSNIPAKESTQGQLKPAPVAKTPTRPVPSRPKKKALSSSRLEEPLFETTSKQGGDDDDDWGGLFRTDPFHQEGLQDIPTVPKPKRFTRSNSMSLAGTAGAGTGMSRANSISVMSSSTTTSLSSSSSSSVRSFGHARSFSLNMDRSNSMVDPLPDLTSPKRAATAPGLDDRGRKKSRSQHQFLVRSNTLPLEAMGAANPSSLGRGYGNGNSFSNIAKFGESWAGAGSPDSAVDLEASTSSNSSSVFDFKDERVASATSSTTPTTMMTTTPAKSKNFYGFADAADYLTDGDITACSPAAMSLGGTGSSTKKKRPSSRNSGSGIFDSPFVQQPYHQDNIRMMSMMDASSEHRSSNSSSTASRLFAPLDATFDRNDSTNRESLFSSGSLEDHMRDMDVDDDDDDTRNGNDTDGSDDDSVDSDFDGDLSSKRSSHHRHSSSLSFNDSFQVVPTTRAIAPVANLASNDILESMTSAQDLHFLIKSLRRKMEHAMGQTIQVAPVADWSQDRKAAFLSWTTKHMGFTLRTAGQNVQYVQISKTKGRTLLKLLEESWVSYKESGGTHLVGSPAAGTPILASSSTTGMFGRVNMDIDSSAKKPPPANAITTHAMAAAPQQLAFSSMMSPMPNISESNDDFESALVQGMQGLGMKDQPMQDAVQRPSPPSNTGLCLDGIDGSFHDQSRPSMDQSASNQDMFMHMQGMTPVRPSTGRAPRPSRLSIGSIGTVGSKHTVASPFPIAPLSAIGKAGGAACMDFVQTPMMKPAESGWGCRPVEGRDWGASEKCCQGSIDELFSKFQVSQSNAGCSPSDEAMQPLRERTGSLCFDFEAASQYRDRPNESPTSVGSYTEHNDDDFAIDEGFSQPSPSAMDALRTGSIMPAREVFRQKKDIRRRETSYLKRQRMSIAGASARNGPIASRKTMFGQPSSRQSMLNNLPSLESLTAAPTFRRSTVHFHDEPPLLEQESDIRLTVGSCKRIVDCIVGFLPENELLRTCSLVSTTWSDAAVQAHANLMWLSVQDSANDDALDDDDEIVDEPVKGVVERSWEQLMGKFPWARFLSDGAFKDVFKVYNKDFGCEEALSIMDVNLIDDKMQVGAELAVSVLLSALVRRGVCPNFVITRGTFSCPFRPTPEMWGNRDAKAPMGKKYVPSRRAGRIPTRPSVEEKGRYQFIRMELCAEGDCEEFLKRLDNEILPCEEARKVIFQIAFALHAAADRHCLKHYDLKLLNIFVQRPAVEDSKRDGDVVLRYGLGQHVFALKTPSENALIAKVADYGTAIIDPETCGQSVTCAQFTTLENTPIDFLLLGDDAQQGHGHDNFGLGLCMLHLLTGHRPYEEILEEVKCPKNLKMRLQEIWEDDSGSVPNFSVIQGLVLSEVEKDEEGHIIDGEPDETLYHTLYRYLVLFGIPKLSSPEINRSCVWEAIKDSLETGGGKTRSGARARGRGKAKKGGDARKFMSDRKKYSLATGNNEYIARARESLNAMEGGMDLLMGLVHFDPKLRTTASEVLNHEFMVPLRETQGTAYGPKDTVCSYTAFSTI